MRDTEGTMAPEELKKQEEESQLGNVQQDWILGAGTSKRIWGELYKVCRRSDSFICSHSLIRGTELRRLSIHPMSCFTSSTLVILSVLDVTL